MLKHALVAFVTLGLMAVNATAQQAPPPEESPPPESLPACPPGEQPTMEQPTMVPAPPPAPVPRAEAPRERHHNMIFWPGDVSVTTGAGPTNYFGSNTTTTTDVGAAWDVRATFGTRSFIALEAAYNGATNNVDQNGVTNGFINSNGIDGDFRLQLPTRVQPYIFAGVGWNHMNLNDAVIVPNQRVSDNQVTVPAGGGLTGYIGGHFTLDVRGTYRFIGNDDLTTVGSGQQSTHQWLAQGRLGYKF